MMLVTSLAVIAACHVAAAAISVDFNYHNYDAMTSLLRQIADQYRNSTKLYSIGRSVQGRELWVMLVTANPEYDEVLKPNVKYVANMHGNEAVGREMMLHLIAHLINGYSTDRDIRHMMHSTNIHIMPSMNPDGFEASVEGECSGVQGRQNANSYDLNRNFPDYFETNNGRQQPETLAVMEWMKKTQFVLSGNLHGGALVASYPFDNIPRNSPTSFRKQGGSSPSPDEDVFKRLATTYSWHHKVMYSSSSCRSGTPPFVNGTTNGAAWYPLKGGMQDYNYVWAGCMEITLEISCCKYPKRHDLPRFWVENEDALLSFIMQAHTGVKGIVKNSEGFPIPNATLRVKGRQFGFRTTQRGEYWRILNDGHHTLEVFADGYQPAEIDVSAGSDYLVVQNITLYPYSSSTAPGGEGELGFHPRGGSGSPSGFTSGSTDSNSGPVTRWPSFTDYYLYPREKVLFPHVSPIGRHHLSPVPFFPPTSNQIQNYASFIFHG